MTIKRWFAMEMSGFAQIEVQPL